MSQVAVKEPQRTAAAEQAGVSVCGHIQRATKKRKFKTELFAFMGNSTACVIHHMPKGLSIFQCTSVLLSSFFFLSLTVNWDILQ